MTPACTKTLKTQEKNADAKYAEAVDEMSQARKNFLARIFSLESSLKAGKDRVDKAARDKNVFADRPGN